MNFSMKYDGVVYYAKAVVAKNKKNCYLQVLNEHKEPYRDKQTGRIIGLYENASAAGMDVINLYRENHQIPQKIKTLPGNSYWINEEGKSIKELIEQM